MNFCPITYKECGNKKYSNEGLKSLSSRLNDLNDLPFTQEELLHEASRRALKMSIQGVQPKLSAKLKPVESGFEIVDIGGEYILKPQSNFYPELPENEDLTMKLAKIVGIATPLHGLIYSCDEKLVYFIKRFDRYGKNKKRAVEDFAQLSGKSRETKYDSSMERVLKIIEQFCTFPVIEKVKLFRLTTFNFLVGNEDMHLKNFSLITRDNKVELSPAYDLINTSIAIGDAIDEVALPIAGKKSNLNYEILIDYFARERLSLNDVIIDKVIGKIKDSLEKMESVIKISFLSQSMKDKYFLLFSSRVKRLGL